MNAPLTARQQEVLDVVRGFIAEHGYPPTRAEIARAMGFKSDNAADDHLVLMERKGVIRIVKGIARGIQLTAPDTKAEARDAA